ncbi:MAG TPA: protein kinase, partial [Longimicrobiaceae bacterium]|nr:protein kinase [Longimicrobiaceae bacterium]
MKGFEHLLAGRTLGDRYRVEALIGRGGMGAVYRATDERLGRAVAVKVISPPAGVAEDTREELRARFQREARAAARLHHPNVVTIHDFGTDAELGLDYLVMGLLEGEDLATRMARDAAFDVGEAAAVLRGAALGLAAGHRIGLVHRDVKPGNIFLSGAAGEVPEVRMLDFGIAKAVADEGTLTHLTRFGHTPLSPAYAAPEQLRADGEPGPACDVYGLGAIGWELLTGARPFSPEEIRRVADGGQVPQPVVTPGSATDGPIGALLLRCLAIDPADRPHDAGAFLDALDAALAGRVLPPLPRRPAAAAVPPARIDRSVASANAPAPLLVPCAECGQLVSRQASACPRCGAPLKRRRRRGGAIAAFVVGSLLAGGGVFALERQGMLRGPSADPMADLTSAVVPLLDTARVVAVRKPVIVHVAAPRWKTSGVESDGGCSRLFDSCLRVRCTLANTGDADGETEVTARVYGRETYRRVRSVRLDAGGRQVMTFDFPEVHNG